MKHDKRLGYFSWDDTFMNMAIVIAQRSKDPNTQNGACVVNNNNLIIGVGYNGFPRGCHDDDLPWVKEVIYDSDKYHDSDICQASRKMLDMAGIKYRQFTPKKKIEFVGHE